MLRAQLLKLLIYQGKSVAMKDSDSHWRTKRDEPTDESTYDNNGAFLMKTTREEGEGYRMSLQCTKFQRSDKVTNTSLGLCTICHLTVDDRNLSEIGIDFERIPSSPHGHLLCHRCIRRFTIQSDTECVLGDAESPPRHSRTVHGTNRSHTRSSEEFESQQRQQRLVHPNVEKPCINSSWPYDYSTTTTAGRISLINYDIGVSEVEISSSNRDNAKIRDKSMKNSSEQDQQRGCCGTIQKEDRDQCMSEMKINNQMTYECSRKPIRCPRIDCAVNVAFSALTHHFLFDHPEVPILSVDPGAKSTLIIAFAALSCDSSRCLALLLVSGKLSLFNGSQINPKYRNRLPLSLLAARLHCKNRYTFLDEGHADGEGEGNVIIVWVAGLDLGHNANTLQCSIQIVDNIENEGFRSLTYTGPINSLRTAQCPRDVFSHGDCIVIHEGLVNRITSDCTKLNVNVIVH